MKDDKTLTAAMMATTLALISDQSNEAVIKEMAHRSLSVYMQHKELMPDLTKGEQDPNDYDLPAIPKELEHRTPYFRSLPYHMQEEIIAGEMEDLEYTKQAMECHVKYSNLPSGLKATTLAYIQTQPDGVTPGVFIKLCSSPYVFLDLCKEIVGGSDPEFNDAYFDWVMGDMSTPDFLRYVRNVYGPTILKSLTTRK